MNTLPRLLVVSFAVFTSVLAARTTPLRVEQTIEPRFPAALALSHVTDGEARVVVNIGADGKLIDWLVTGYTDRSFAEEAVTVIKAWRYVAPTEDGEAVGIRTELRFQFESRGRVISLTAIDTPEVLMKQMGIEPALVTKVCGPHELDRPLVPVSAASPLYPASSTAAAAGKPHSVVVDFYVDENGQPRMPVVINSAQEHYAIAAVDALSRWRFAAPTRAGRPVAVRVRQEFIFPGRS
jgi:TonB family protein